jgi:predicted metal-dependent phosphoesterase TrpH
MAETVRIDLHCHSSASDGDHSPAHVAKRLADIGVTWASLTDHNTVEGLAEFQAALKRHAISYVPGVEIDARCPMGVLHILGYGFDPQNEALLAVLKTVRQPWRTSMHEFLARVRGLFGGTQGPPAIPCLPDGRDPIARPLTTAMALCLVHEAGGKAFLAHPLESLRSFKGIEAALDLLQEEGLDGIEVFHKSYPDGVRAALLALAVRRGLTPTGGSDFHGLDHSDGASLGVDVPVEQWAQIVRSVGKRSEPVPFPASVENNNNI